MVYLSDADGPDVIVCFVHKVDDVTTGGWRWAVHIGQSGPADLKRCLNAGWAASQGDAMSVGDSHAATAVVGLRSAGVGMSYAGVMVLDTDPVAHLTAIGDDRVRII